MSTITRDGVDSLSIDRGEPNWLKTFRLNAWEKYLQMPSPSKKDDVWRKTRLEKLDLAKVKTSLPSFEKPSQDKLSSCSVLSRFSDRAGAVYSTTENSWQVDLDSELSKKGVVFVPLNEALESHESLIQEWLKESNNETNQKFDLMQEALFNCGAFLYIPKDVVIEKPFLVVNKISADNNNGNSLFPRLFVCAQTHSKVTVLNVFTSEGLDKGEELSFINAQSYIHANAGAHVSYIELEVLESNVFFVGKNNNKVDKDANCTSVTVGLSGYQLKSDITTTLTEDGAHGAMLGVVLGDKEEHLSYNTVQVHDAPNTTSDINFRIALKDEAVSAYQGNIKVAKEAQKTNAFQTNKNLLLGKNAKADSIPKLEILANDVKCSHGATVGPVDDNQVFYLMSRGLDRKTAEELIVGGFFDTVLESLPDKTANDWIHELVKEKIHSK